MVIERHFTKQYVSEVYRGITWPLIFSLVKREIFFRREGFGAVILRSKIDFLMEGLLQAKLFKASNNLKGIKSFLARIPRFLKDDLKARRKVLLSNLPAAKSFLKESLLDIERRKIERILLKMGMIPLDTREIVTYQDNFDNLNIPPEHPARLDHCFFPIDNNLMLRSHLTSCHSNSKLYSSSNKMISTIGRSFRDDKDSTHLKAFHQIEWLIKEDGSLKKFLIKIQLFFRYYFQNNDLSLYIRPSFFPFTFSSFELDMEMEGIYYEIGGAGFMKENITSLRERWPALAYGLERLIMIKYGFKEIEECYQEVQNVT